MKKFIVPFLCVSAFFLFSFAVIYTSGVSLRSAEVVLLAGICSAAAASDIMSRRIPDLLILAGILLRLCCMISGGAQTVLSAACVSFLTAVMITAPVFLLVLLMDRLLGKETMGGGDLKLIFMLSLFFPVHTALYGLLYACVLGVLTIPVFLIRKTGQQGYPFGPALAAGFLLSFLFHA